MNRGYLVFAVLLVAAVGIGWAISSQDDPENITPTNGNNTPPVNENGNPIYYYFYSDTCPSCKIMERDTFGNSTVIEALEANFTFTRVNTGKNRQLAQKYGIVYDRDNPVPADDEQAPSC